MPFRISALSPEPFAPLFALTAAALPAPARRIVATGSGEPCRVSLCDAAAGETLLLVHHEHQSADTPFRAGHAIYVRADAEQAHPQADEVPLLFRSRLLSVRAFDAEGMMRDADVVAGTDLEGTIAVLLADARTAYLHLHAAKPGCYLARVDRA